MLYRRVSLDKAFVLAAVIHGFFVLMFSVAVARDDYRSPRYLEVSLGPPPLLRHARTLPPGRAQLVDFTPDSLRADNFAYYRRERSLEIAVDKVETASVPGDAWLGNQASEGVVFFPAGSREEDYADRVLFSRIISPEARYWKQRVAIERELRLRVRLLPDGRVGLVRLVSGSGNSTLDDMVRETVLHWQFNPSAE